MMKNIIWLCSLVLFSLTVLVHQAKAEEIGSKEDCINFNPDGIAVKKIQDRWKLLEGNRLVLDFANQKNEADQSLQLIKQYGFDSICLVSRPDLAKTYLVTKQKAKATTVFIVRHAEKDTNYPDSNNPPLTKAGKCRAETLARMLKNSGVSVIFSTDFIRTRDTVNYYANTQTPALTPNIYTTPQEVANKIKSSQYAGKSILIASHSGMVEQIVQSLLGADSMPAIGEEFNNLVLVTIPPNGILITIPANGLPKLTLTKTTPTLTRMKYEIWRPAYLLPMDCNNI
jgi:2,3-bisphosphoglycerate-dependent phosphoglycerate mutase